MLEVGDLITLSNNEQYIVMKRVNYNSISYVYLISRDGISDIMICSYDNDNLKRVDDEKLFIKLLELYNQ